MVMHSHAAEELQSLLSAMEDAIDAMHELLAEEQEAIGNLDSAGVNKLSEKRKMLWQVLKGQKEQCQQLFLRHGMPAEIEMSHFIDMHLAEDAPILQAQRQSVFARLADVSQSNEYNGIRLRAAAESIAETLQGLGLLQAKATYGRDGTL